MYQAFFLVLAIQYNNKKASASCIHILVQRESQQTNKYRAMHTKMKIRRVKSRAKFSMKLTKLKSQVPSLVWASMSSESYWDIEYCR